MTLNHNGGRKQKYNEKHQSLETLFNSITQETGNEEKASSLFYSLIERHLFTGGRVLDLGCGTGQFAVRLVSLGYDVVAVDISGESIQKAQKRSQGLQNINFTQESIENITENCSQTFEHIIAVKSLHHLTLPMLNTVLMNIKDHCLTAGGRLLILDVMSKEDMEEHRRSMASVRSLIKWPVRMSRYLGLFNTLRYPILRLLDRKVRANKHWKQHLEKEEVPTMAQWCQILSVFPNNVIIPLLPHLFLMYWDKPNKPQ